MPARRKGRILAFQTLYSWEAANRLYRAVTDRAGGSGRAGGPGRGRGPGRAGWPDRGRGSGRAGGAGQAGAQAALVTGSPEKPAGLPELLEFSWLETDRAPEILDFSRLLIRGTIENIGEVDAMICAHLKNWDFSRINEVDLAILRISTYTLMYQRDASPTVVISEAIGICQEYGTDESFRFVNGVLDSIRRTLKQKALPAAQECAAGPGPK